MKLTKWIQERFGVKTVTYDGIDVTKKEIAAVDKFAVDITKYLEDRTYLDTLTGDDKKKFLERASAIHTDGVLKTVVHSLMNTQAAHSILQAPDSQVIMFDRAGINVLQLLLEEFERLHGMYLSITSPPEDFDKGEVI